MQIADTVNLGTFAPPSVAYGGTACAGTGAIDSLELLISNVITYLTIFAGIFFIIFFFLGAFKWLTAGGDSGKVSKARDEMVQGVLGLIVMVVAYSVIGLIGTILGLRLLEPGAVLKGIIPHSASQAGECQQPASFNGAAGSGNSDNPLITIPGTFSE